MSTEIEMKFVLPDRFTADKVRADEFFTRYVKDEFILRDTYSEYFDTPEWVLADNGYFLRVREINGVSVASLKHGGIDIAAIPGLFNGQKWLCMFDGAETLVTNLLEKAAPDEFAKLVAGKILSPCFYSRYTRYYTTLYMPDMVRIELTLDAGELIAANKIEALCEMGLELLYGDTASFLNFCEQLTEHFGFPPELLTKQQRALRLLRSRN